MTRLFLLLALLALPASVQAQPKPDPTPPEDSLHRYKAVTDIIIDEVQVGAGVRGPMGHFGLEKRRATFNPLLRLRDDFDQEMVESVLQIR